MSSSQDPVSPQARSIIGRRFLTATRINGTMQQAQDFLDESEALAAVLGGLSEAQWAEPTQFKRWTSNDVIVHLHFWNRAADLSLVDPDAFSRLLADVFASLRRASLREFENAYIAERGSALLAAWSAQFRDMATRWAGADPKARVKWAGPDMSARSSITARQMETWAHGQAVFDRLGIERRDSDRLRNIVMLGVNTFGWSHRTQGLDVPAQMPRLSLTAPSGEVWQFEENAADAAGSISGRAVEFAQVVTQTRNIADTALVVVGDVAQRWMQTAQCFAGAKETPPAPGTRFVQRA
jgi:uncharacterized protein (TIGR03084 family)